MIRTAMLSFVLLLVSIFTFADEPRTLAWKLKPGQQLRVSTTSEMTRSTKIKTNVDETKIKTIIDVLWNVKEVSADGVATIEQRPERLAISLEHRLDPVYILDSDILKKSPNLKGPDRDALRLLMDGSATIKLDARGAVIESSVPPDWLEKLKETPLADLVDQLALAATPRLLAGVHLSLPAEPIKSGHEWRVESEKAEGGEKELSGSAKYVYQGEKPLLGESRDRIDVELTIEGLPADVLVTNQANQGVFWFDSKVGVPVSLELKQDWKAEKTYRDNIILLTTSGLSKTTWTVIPAPSN